MHFQEAKTNYYFNTFKKMSIKFKILPKKNPQDITAPEKYYATSVANGETSLESLAEMIAYQCTLLNGHRLLRCFTFFRTQYANGT